MTAQKSPDLDEVSLQIRIPPSDDDQVVDRSLDGATISNWDSYTFSTHFLTPADGFQFTVSMPPLGSDSVAYKIAPGMGIVLKVNGRTTCTGVVDAIEYTSDRNGGTVMTIEGRDILGDVVDSSLDPFQTFQPTQSLADIINAVLEPFKLSLTATDNAANRSLIVGNKYGAKRNRTTVTKTGKLRKGSGEVVASVRSHQCKPYPNEGCYEFIERLAKRSGLHIWANADGSGVIAGQPDFNQDPTFELTRLRGQIAGAKNNIVSGHVKRSRLDQPSVIIGSASAGGGDFAHSRVRAIMVNELVARYRNSDNLLQDVKSVEDILNKFQASQVLNPRVDELDAPDAPFRTPSDEQAYPFARPLFLEDKDASTQEELNNFVRREMAIRQQSYLQIDYEVAGHTQNGKTWAVDTIATVVDDVGNLNGPFWIMGVTFKKSRSSGTTTSLKLILPNTLRF